VRRLPAALLSAALIPVAVVAPVVARPLARPHPVPPRLHELALPAGALLVGPGAAIGAGTAIGPLRLPATTNTPTFRALGATWDAGSLARGDSIEVRIREHGSWSGWTTLGVTDGGPDGQTAEARGAAARAAVHLGLPAGRIRQRQSAEPLWVGQADAVQARVLAPGGHGPAHLRLVLIDPGTSAADGILGASPVLGGAVAQAQAARPGIYTRAQWGADESLRLNSCPSGPEYAPTIKVVFVHHTDTPNNYAPSDVPAIIRSIYAYHVETNGWCDIGYNFLVDRFGRLWEGRYGGMDQAVIGAHAGGFNYESIGVAMIGTYDSLTPAAAVTAALGRLVAWRLGLVYANPVGRNYLTAAPFSGSRYASGTRVLFNAVSGHRDADYTDCPGTDGYAALATVRADARRDLGTAFIFPSAGPATTSYAGHSVTVRAGLMSPASWVLDISNPCLPAVTRQITGSSTTSLAATWNLTDGSGAAVPPGVYTLRLSGTGSLGGARTWTGQVTVGPPAPAPLPTGSPPPTGAAGLVPVNPVRVVDTRNGVGTPKPGTRWTLGPGARLDVPVLGVGGVPASGVAAVAVNVTAVCPTVDTEITVAPAGRSRPGTAAVDVPAGVNTATSVLVGVGAGGALSLWNSAGYVDVLVDVVGYLPTTGGSVYHPVRETQVFSTAGKPLTSGQTVTVQPGALVPAGARGVVATVTALAPRSPGWLAVAPTAATTTSSLNVVTGRTASNTVLTGVASDGSFTIRDGVTTTNVVVTIEGYFAPTGGSGGLVFTAVSPTRIVDTATGVGTSGALAAATTRTVSIAGHGPVPAGASAVVLSLTAWNATAPSGITVWAADGTAAPAVTDVPVLPGAPVGNLVVVPLGSTGGLALRNAAGSVQLSADVLGYFTASATP